MLGKRKRPSLDHRLAARQRPVVFLPETQIVADIAFQGSLDLANIVQHFFVPTKGELIARIHEFLLPTFGTLEEVETFLDELGNVGGLLTGSLLVAAFCDEKQWQFMDVDCVVPFEAGTKLDSILTFFAKRKGTKVYDNWDPALLATIDLGGTHNRRLKILVTNANIEPRQFVDDKFDFEFVRNFYSPADDVVHIGCPTSLVQRSSFLDSRFNKKHTESDPKIPRPWLRGRIRRNCRGSDLPTRQQPRVSRR